ncbi:malate synthase A [Pseudactinotalea terrae]|uniref:malate synthase A n=1 Tax=Pseudactinotalea terrae TaxID=1743262 RepID=UPI0012E149D8|nr:malate synthase A [Pseudactinotalea terrae]
MDIPVGIAITAPLPERAEDVLTPRALELIGKLHRALDARRHECLAAREQVVADIAAGGTLDFLPETADVRADDSWRVAEPAPGLIDRRVEITGPTDRKMTINALNSGAKVWLADHEDANTPRWESVIGGQLNLLDAVNRTIDFTAENGKSYTLAPDADLATIVVRPRGWHMDEKHIEVDGEPTSGGLVDFALYVSTAGLAQIAKGLGPYFYLPKMEHHLEARLWNEAFAIASEHLGFPVGTIRATCLIETIPAAFQMEEILYELREHSAGLNAGRWDYLFSIVKTFRSRGAEFLLPDRNSITMTAPFMRAYTELLVRTCHKRGAHAIGGMAAFIPSKDAGVNAAAFEKVTADKTREAGDGFDGSWVAHPGMVITCREVFDAVLGDRPNQLDNLREDVHVEAAQLLDIASAGGEVTEAGLRSNVDVALQYLRAWLGGLGAVAIHNLMEDAATAEISRSQIWQWLRGGIVLSDTGRIVTKDLVQRCVEEVVQTLPGEPSDYDEAKELFLEVAVSDDYADFLTTPAYARMD